MKIAGVEISGAPEEILVLPRLSGDIVIRARGLSDLEKFEKLVPEPSPPVLLTKDGKKFDYDDPGYKSVVKSYGEKRLAFLVIHSLQDIEWDTVDPDNPNTWPNWESDCKKAGLTQVEVNRIIQLVLETNSLSEVKLKAAREVFLRGRQPA